MFYLPPETFWKELLSNISNLYFFNTVLNQRISKRRTSDKHAVLLPHPSNSTSLLRWIIRAFMVTSSNLYTGNPGGWYTVDDPYCMVGDPEA